MEHDVSELIDLIKRLSPPSVCRNGPGLYALTEPKHPYFSTVVRIARGDGPCVREPRWYSHPFWLKLLRRGLDDTTPTGTKYRIEGDRLAFEQSADADLRGYPTS